MKLAIAFWGITRSLKFTLDSIQNNILHVFKKNNIDCDIFMHTYNLSTTYINERNNEKKENVDNEEYKLLGPKYLMIHDQEYIKKTIKIKSYRTHKDPWNTNYNSVDNFILAQFSKSMLIRMIDKTKKKYDYILFVRPDCFYNHKFDIKYFKHVNNKTICIPNFHLCSKFRFNDRFAITNMQTYKLYGGVFKYLFAVSKKKPLHSETIIGELMSKYRLNIVRIPFKFKRVRCDGKIPNSDKNL